MKEQILVIRNQYHQQAKSDIFLCDPKSDIFLLMDDHIFPLHRNQIMESKFFILPENQKKKIIICQKQFSAQKTTNIFAYMYGFPIYINRYSDLPQYLEIISYFQIETLAQKLIDDFFNNFMRYELFLLLEISQKYKLPCLKKQCYDVLNEENYSSLQSCIYDVLRLSDNTFENLIAKYCANNNAYFLKGQSKETFVNKLTDIFCQYNDPASYFCKEQRFFSMENTKNDSDFQTFRKAEEILKSRKVPSSSSQNFSQIKLMKRYSLEVNPFNYLITQVDQGQQSPESQNKNDGIKTSDNSQKSSLSYEKQETKMTIMNKIDWKSTRTSLQSFTLKIPILNKEYNGEI